SGVVRGDNLGKYAPRSVDSAVHAPGGGRAAGRGQPAGASTGGGPVCSYRPATDWERWVRGIPVGGAVPGVIAAGKDTIDPDLHLYARTCNGVLDYLWINTAGSPAAAAVPAVVGLAREAFSRLGLPLPVPGRSPGLRRSGGRPGGLVGGGAGGAGRGAHWGVGRPGSIQPGGGGGAGRGRVGDGHRHAGSAAVRPG